MVSRPDRPRRRAGHGWRARVQQLRDAATRQFITRNRRGAFGLSLAVVAIGGAGLLLWVRALRILFVLAAIMLVYDIVAHKAGPGIIATIVITALFADVLARTRAKLGLQGLRGNQMLIELRDRTRDQGKLPALGDGWGSEVVLRPAGGASFGGDFVVSYSDGKTLEVALVDVSGKGIDAGTRALLLSGAFGGLLGSVPNTDFLAAANAYLRRGRWNEGFVTAVHLSLDLTSGEYVISSAGHLPAVHYDAASGRWRVGQARGIVLGVVPDLQAVPTSNEEGVLRRGDALMLYTDGLVEAPGRDIDDGIDRLLGEAERLVKTGFRTGVEELVTTLERDVGSNDDRALVLIWRS